MRRIMILVSSLVILLSGLAVPRMGAAEPEQTVCGDVNGDGNLIPSDLYYFVRYMWEGGPPPVDMWAANYSGCAGIDVQDLTCLASRMVNNLPRGECDVDTACVPDSYGAISLESVRPLTSSQTLLTGSRPRMSIRFTANTPAALFGFALGFRIYSPDGAEWSSTTISYTDAFPGGPGSETFPYQFDVARPALGFSADGSGADTLGVGGLSLFHVGMPVGYDEVSFNIDLGSIPESFAGKTICLDSSFYPPAGSWMLSYIYDVGCTPSWDGPHCFQVESCCLYRGDLTLSDGINVSDLTYLVALLFQGGPGPACLDVADVDDDGGFNVSDLTYLMAFLFQGGAPPPGC